MLESKENRFSLFAETEKDNSANAKNSAVAVINLRDVLDHYRDFAKRKDDLESEIACAEITYKHDKSAVAKLEEDLKKLIPGTSAHARLKAKLWRQNIELQATLAEQRKRFLRAETQLQYDAYKEIVAEINEYITGADIVAVFRTHDRDVIEEQHGGCGFFIKPILNNSLVAYKKHIDITKEIVQRLNQVGRE